MIVIALGTWETSIPMTAVRVARTSDGERRRLHRLHGAHLRAKRVVLRPVVAQLVAGATSGSTWTDADLLKVYFSELSEQSRGVVRALFLATYSTRHVLCQFSGATFITVNAVEQVFFLYVVVVDEGVVVFLAVCVYDVVRVSDEFVY